MNNKTDNVDYDGKSANDELIDRILMIVDVLGSQAKFAQVTGLHRSVVSAIVNRKINNISFNVIRTITDNTAVNADWLLRGTGPMIDDKGSSDIKARAAALQLASVLGHQEIEGLESDAQSASKLLGIPKNPQSEERRTLELIHLLLSQFLSRS